jgi:predicted short-subunit dehydrogenase-like oxidoreductase (DUF2520 family)
MRELERDLPTTARRTPEPAGAVSGLAIVGAGRVGSSIAAAAQAAGLAASIGGRADAAETVRDAEVVLLCVPDEAIAEAAATLAAAGVRPLFAGHTSGATALDALAPLAAVGAQTFSLHPLQTVPDRETDFTAAPCAISGSSAEALTLARALATELGMRPFEIAEADRVAYHAAAAIASNFLVALQESAAGLLASTGVEDARELLAPLVLRTAANWSERGADALTGPIARGDTETVERHRDELRRRAPELLDLYDALAERARATASGPEGDAR